MNRDQIYIIGGGTVFHVRPHLALSAPAYGATAYEIKDILECLHQSFEGEIYLYTTKMAGNVFDASRCAPDKLRYLRLPEDDPRSNDEWCPDIETNADVLKLVLEIVENPRAKILFMPVALCDFEGFLIGPPHEVKEADGKTHLVTERTPAGKSQLRVSSSTEHHIALEPAPKVIRRVRKERKDIFLVGFKTTTGATADEQFEAGLKLLKEASCNLVLANDLHTRLNMVVTPEQARYAVTQDRTAALATLVQLALSRSEGHFTRTHVMGDDAVSWDSPSIPQSLRTVVEHCIKRGAYRPFMGKTVGHFAVKRDENVFYTSPRGKDFNKLLDPHSGVQMIHCRVIEDNPLMELSEHVKVGDLMCYGGKPSVGGMSQRIIFKEHPEVDCIVHFHCPMKEGSHIPTREQWPYECGSHECGKNTSDGLTGFVQYGLKAVMLDKHGPNIVFKRDIDPKIVIDFIENNFDLTRQTSELT